MESLDELESSRFYTAVLGHSLLHPAIPLLRSEPAFSLIVSLFFVQVVKTVSLVKVAKESQGGGGLAGVMRWMSWCDRNSF